MKTGNGNTSKLRQIHLEVVDCYILQGKVSCSSSERTPKKRGSCVFFEGLKGVRCHFQGPQKRYPFSPNDSCNPNLWSTPNGGWTENGLSQGWTSVFLSHLLGCFCFEDVFFFNRKETVITRRKWTNVSKKGTICKGKFNFQPSIFRGCVGFRKSRVCHPVLFWGTLAELDEFLLDQQLECEIGWRPSMLLMGTFSVLNRFHKLRTWNPKTAPPSFFTSGFKDEAYFPRKNR